MPEEFASDLARTATVETDSHGDLEERRSAEDMTWADIDWTTAFLRPKRASTVSLESVVAFRDASPHPS